MAYSSTADSSNSASSAEHWSDQARRYSGDAFRSSCRAWNRRPWSAFEIAIMVIGFIVFWPIGLALLFYILWKKRRGEDLNMPQWATNMNMSMRPAGSSGNRAFEEWKNSELARLEEERRKLYQAQREFEEFLDQLKHAKDKEEFDRFMEARNRASKPQA